jgi:hypothetical protein
MVPCDNVAAIVFPVLDTLPILLPSTFTFALHVVTLAPPAA